MLTEIEWWGGLLFIWIAICYRVAYKDYMNAGKLSPMFLVFNLFFVATGIVLALYFYALESGGIKIVYLAVLAVGLVSAGLAMFWPADEEDQQAAEEELGPIVSALAGVILFLPLLISLLLGLVKSFTLIGSL